MDSTQWHQPAFHDSSITIDPHSSYYQPYTYPQNPNPNPNPNPTTHESSYTSVSSDPVILPPGSGSLYQGGNGNSDHQYYYDWDPNSQSWVLKDSNGQYVVDPLAYAGAGITTASTGTEQPSATYSSSLLANNLVQPLQSNPWKKYPRKTKIIQSAYCEVCKVECNSRDILERHKLGKKHIKNMEKLQEATALAMNPSAVIGPQENPNKGKSSKKKLGEAAPDLETKRRKIVEGGAAVQAVRMCPICNVVCNSDIVFSYHLGGQKHAAMARKLAAAQTGVAMI